MDDCNDNDKIANIFLTNYMELYNSVPYDLSEMKSIDSTVLSRIIMNSSSNEYTIIVTDVKNSAAQLKSGKSDVSERLFSDYFIHGTHCLIFSIFIIYFFVVSCVLS